MRRSITITLPDELGDAVDSLTREEGISSTEVVCKSLSDYIYFRKLKKTREAMVSQAEARGIVTDEDVFNAL